MPKARTQILQPLRLQPQTDNPAVRYHLTHPPKPKKEKLVVKEEPDRAKIWAIDFDGTLHFGRFPNIGPANEDLIHVLQIAKTMGVLLILWTSREGLVLDEAVEWCRDHGLEFDAVNDNVPSVVKLFGGNSRKVAADLYIDDRAMSWSKGRDGLSKLLSSLPQR